MGVVCHIKGIMKLLLITLLFLCSNFLYGQRNLNYEQLAAEYFFTEIFHQEFGTIKTLGYSGRTDSLRHSYSIGIMFKCDQWSQEEKEQFMGDFPVEVKKVDLGQYGYRIKNAKAKRHKLVINILPSFNVNSKVYTLISVYKRLHFVEYFLFESNLNGDIITYCKRGQVI